MVKIEEEKPLTNKEETKEKGENSLLSYEYDADDDLDLLSNNQVKSKLFLVLISR